MNPQTMTGLQKIELGVVVAVALATISFAFWLGGLNERVTKLENIGSEELSKIDLADLLGIEKHRVF